MASRSLGFAAVAAAAGIPVVAAQNAAVSATAAWSSQIVAFWGAIGIGVRSSNGQLSLNAVTSWAAQFRSLARAWSAASALQGGDWYLFAPGYNGGNTRIHAVVICWTSASELWSLCFKLSLLMEAVGVQRWLVLVLGRRCTDHGGAFWTHSPRSRALCTTKFADTNESYSALAPEFFQQLLQVTEYDDTMVDNVAKLVCDHCERRPTRGATRDESPLEVQEATTLGRHMTSYQLEGVSCAYVATSKLVGAFASSRTLTTDSSVWTYCIVHLIVCVAVGLMGASSGRGLAVWLFTPRLVLSKLGAEFIAGDDVLVSLLGFNKLRYHVATDGSSVASLAGDAFFSAGGKEEWWPVVLGLGLNVVELVLVVGGWLYGALRVQKLPPRGLVGHGMLWLATMVTLGLSLQTLLGTYERVSARLIGIFRETQYVRQVIAEDCRVSSGLLQSYLQLVWSILGKTMDDTSSVEASLSLIRDPTFCSEVQQHVASRILKYSYAGDTLVGRGDNKVTTAKVYPWIQISICVALTVASGAFGPVYAYLKMPRWSKLAAEVLLACSATWFATLARTSPLLHNEKTKICHMVSTMVASAVWYVGVKDVG